MSGRDRPSRTLAEVAETLPDKHPKEPRYQSPILKTLGDGKCERCKGALMEFGTPFTELKVTFTRVDAVQATRSAMASHLNGFPLQLGEIMGTVDTKIPREVFKTYQAKLCGFCQADFWDAFPKFMKKKVDHSGPRATMLQAMGKKDEADVLLARIQREGEARRRKRKAKK